MPAIFYSWESDRPNNVNRSLIRRALDDAVARLNVDLPIEEAARVDQDTQGVPGTPPIADTILAKIDECAVFVPDVTFVGGATRNANRRRLPNPNVMIEYGYALKSLGHERMLPIFNEAFGEPKDLPFDMAHRRWPITYRAHPNDDEGTRRAARDRLSAEIERALRAILINARRASSEPAKFIAAEPKDGPSSFLAPDEPLTARVGRGKDPDAPLRLRPGPRLFLRLIPIAPRPPLSDVEAASIVQKVPLWPPEWRRAPEATYQSRNRHGAFYFLGSKDDPSVALTVSQLFRSGEIWGIDTYLVARELRENAGVRFNFIPTAALEREFEALLEVYLNVARHLLRLTLPLRLIVGATGISGYRLAVSSHEFWDRFIGEIHVSEVICEGEISNYDARPADLLKKFYYQLWDAAGVPHPRAHDTSGE